MSSGQARFRIATKELFSGRRSSSLRRSPMSLPARARCMSANPQPKVLHIVPALFGAKGVLGGAERYTLELARYMADATPTRLLTFGDESRTERIGNLEVRVIGNPWYVRGQRSNPFSAAIFSEIKRADVVHCHQQHILASSMAAAFS